MLVRFTMGGVPTEVYILQEKDKIMALFAEVDTQPGLAFVS